VFCNQALATWFEVDAAELIGRRCNYHSQPKDEPVERCVAGLCPPPEAFAGLAVKGVVGYRRERGGYVEREAEFVPLGGDPLQDSAVLVVLSGTDVADAEPSQRGPGDLSAHQLHHALARFRGRQNHQFSLNRLVGVSPAMRRVRNQVDLAMHSRSAVQVVGPRGSGREHVARTIHYAGEEGTHAPLVPLSCSLLDAELLRTTVTAFMRQCAELETEQPAALLLLEVDQLADDAQSELAGLLAISELELQPIATARQRLLDMAARGEFREDLAFALTTLVIQLPALSERREDVPLLTQAFVEQLNAEGKHQRAGFTPEALDLLDAYTWPENVDELAAVVAEAHRRADGSQIQAADLPRKIHLAAGVAAHPVTEEESIVMPDFLARIETELIRRALTRSRGNKTKAAQLLGMNRARLLRRLTQLGLQSGADVQSSNSE
jgi:DNA-binding NtrC family response regulator